MKNVLLKDDIRHTQLKKNSHVFLSPSPSSRQHVSVHIQRLKSLSLLQAITKLCFPNSVLYENTTSLLHWGCFHMRQQDSLFMAITQFSFSQSALNKLAHTLSFKVKLKFLKQCASLPLVFPFGLSFHQCKTSGVHVREGHFQSENNDIQSIKFIHCEHQQWLHNAMQAPGTHL